MKLRELVVLRPFVCRAPHGARGLKHCMDLPLSKQRESRPAWGAWIETEWLAHRARLASVAPRMGRVD